MPYVGSKPPAAPVDGSDINDGSIETVDLADSAVTNSKLATGAVGANTKLAAGVVTNHAIAANTIQISKLATTGTANSTTYLTGAGAFAAAGGGFKSIQVFTANGTWTKPAGINTIEVWVVGGGGSGAASGHQDDGVSSGAGGGGAYKVIDVSAISSETVTVGAGGSGVTETNNGNAGGTSSFGAHCSATGGAGGTYETSDAGILSSIGGSGSSGDINVNGQGGGVVRYNGTQFTPMPGGDGAFGFGHGGQPHGGAPAQRYTGISSVGYGSGTSGQKVATGTATSATAGGGLVLVKEYE